MKTQKSVIKKILEIENLQKLSSEKVELKMDDYKKFLNDAVKENQKVEKVIGEIQAIQKEKSRLNKIVGDASVSMGNILDKASQQLKLDIKAAADLGVDSKELRQEFEFLKDNIGRWQKVAEKASQITKQ